MLATISNSVSTLPGHVSRGIKPNLLPRPEDNCSAGLTVETSAGCEASTFSTSILSREAPYETIYFLMHELHRKKELHQGQILRVDHSH